MATPGRIHVLLPIIIWGSFAPHLVPADSQKELDVLRGIKQIGVMIGLDVRIQEAGITTDVLRPDIEAKLRQAKFQVISKAELLKRNLEDPTLIVWFANTTNSGGVFSYKWELILRHHRLVPGHDDPKADGPTWSINRAGLIRAGDVGAIRADVNAAIDDFIRAYRSANSAGIR